MKPKMILAFSLLLIVIGLPLLIFSTDTEDNETVVGKVVSSGGGMNIQVLVPIKSNQRINPGCVRTEGFWVINNKKPAFFAKKVDVVKC